MSTQLVVAEEDYYPCVITHFSKFQSVVNIIEELLTERQLRKFKKSIFGPLMKAADAGISAQLVHHFMLREVVGTERERDAFEKWYLIGKNLVRFSKREWCLITGLDCGETYVQKEAAGSDRLLQTYLGGDLVTVEEFENIFQRLDFIEMDDNDAVGLALFYFVERVLLAKKGAKRRVDYLLLNAASDLEYFYSISWGTISWWQLYKSMSYQHGKAVKHKSDRRKLGRGETCNFEGFIHGVQAFILEACPEIARRFAEATDKKRRPRILKWKIPRNLTQLEMRNCFNNYDEKLKHSLTRTSKEKTEWYYESLVPMQFIIPAWVTEFKEAVDGHERLSPAAEYHEGPSSPLDHHQRRTSPLDHYQGLSSPEDNYEEVFDRDAFESRSKNRFDRVQKYLDELRSEFASKSELQQLRNDYEQLKNEHEQMKNQHIQLQETVNRFIESRATFGEASNRRASSLPPMDNDVPNLPHEENEVFDLTGDSQGDSVVVRESPHFSKFGRQLKKGSKVISPFLDGRRKRKPLDIRQIMRREDDVVVMHDPLQLRESQLHPMDPVTGIQLQPVLVEFLEWYYNGKTSTRNIKFEKDFFSYILRENKGLVGWLGSEHVIAYERLLSIRQHENPSLPQRCTHVDTWFFSQGFKTWPALDSQMLEVCSSARHFTRGLRGVYANEHVMFDVR